MTGPIIGPVIQNECANVAVTLFFRLVLKTLPGNAHYEIPAGRWDLM